MPDWANFCTECGTPLKSAPQQSQQPVGSSDFYDLHLLDAGPNREEVTVYIKNSCNWPIQQAYKLVSNSGGIRNIPAPVAFDMYKDLCALSANVLLKPSESAPAPQTNELVDLYLHSAGPHKLEVVKYIMNLPGWTMADAKLIVDHTPVIIYRDIPEDKAMSIIRDLRNLGAEALHM